MNSFHLVVSTLCMHEKVLKKIHPGLNRRAYYCTLRGCKSHYEDVQVLKAHYNDKHQMEFESPFVCKDCGSSFILEDALFYHQKTIHSYENEIVKCSPCNLDFYSTGKSNF